MYDKAIFALLVRMSSTVYHQMPLPFRSSRRLSHGLDPLLQLLEGKALLVLEMTIVGAHLAHHDLVLVGVPPPERGPGLVDVLSQGHADVGLAGGDELGLQGVELGLDGGGHELDDADVAGVGGGGELGAEGPGEGVEGGLGGAVAGAAGEGHEGEGGGDGEDGGAVAVGRGRAGEEVREEGGGGEERGEVVGGGLGGGLGGDVPVRGLGEVEGALDARVEDYAGEAGVRLCDAVKIKNKKGEESYMSVP